MTHARYGAPDWPAPAQPDRATSPVWSPTPATPPPWPARPTPEPPRKVARHRSGEWPTIRARVTFSKPAREDKSRWHWLLFVPIVLPLLPPLYNRVDPALFGIPFFYWCQLGFAFLASGVIAFVHHKTR